MTTWTDGGMYGQLKREVASEDGDYAIATVWVKTPTTGDAKPYPEGEANFRLILQAPKMLEALKAIVELDPAFWCEVREEGIVAVCDQCKAIARAAIAAVKGEQ